MQNKSKANLFNHSYANFNSINLSASPAAPVSTESLVTNFSSNINPSEKEMNSTEDTCLSSSQITGISLYGLLILSEMFMDLTMNLVDLRKEVIEKTLHNHLSLMDILPTNAEIKGPATSFISYDSRIRFCDLISAIMVSTFISVYSI